MRWCCVLLGIVLSLGQAGLASGQDRLPPDVLIASPPLSPDQRKAIEGYVKAWGDLLLNGDATEVAQARVMLAEPLALGGTSDEFKRRYNLSLVNKLKLAVTSQRVIVRLNSMIVAIRVTGKGADALVQIGLADANAGVRYWAAKAVAGIARSQGFAPSQQQAILQKLSQVIEKETSNAVLSQLLQGLGALDISEAVNMLLRSLNQRVAVYATDPDAPYLPAHDALQKLYIDLVKALAGGDPVDDAVRGLAQTAYRYMTLATRQLKDAQELDEILQRDKANMVRTCDQILRWVVDALAPGTRLPETITSALTRGDWGFVQVQVQRWGKILMQTPPFLYEQQDLAVQSQ